MFFFFGIKKEGLPFFRMLYFAYFNVFYELFWVLIIKFSNALLDPILMTKHFKYRTLVITNITILSLHEQYGVGRNMLSSIF